MERVVKLLFVLFLTCGSLFASFDGEFAQIKRELATDPSKAYTDLQSLYLQVILDGDKQKQRQVLETLIKASKKLNFDYGRYESALAALKPEPKDSPATASSQKTVAAAAAKIKNIRLEKNRLQLEFSRATKLYRSFTLKKGKYRYVYDFKAVLPQVVKTFSYNGLEIKASQFDKTTVRVVVSSSDKIYIQKAAKASSYSLILPEKKEKIQYKKAGKPATIKKVALRDNLLRVTFSAKPTYKDFILKRSKYRYVYDFPAVLPQVAKSFKYMGDSIKLSQFNKSTTRLVVTSSKKLTLKPSISGSEFILAFPKSGKSPAIMDRKQKALTVVIDPGHGGKDPGAVGYRNYREKIVVYDISARVKKYLEKSGINVIMTRNKGEFIKLSRRTKFANAKKADVFVSIHANASRSKKLHGVETYFLSPARSKRAKRVAALENKDVMDQMKEWSSKNTFLTLMNREKIIESNKLAIDVQKNMLYYLKKRYKGVRDGGVREAPFWVLVGAQMPAVLVELGYITNPTEAKRLVLNRYNSYQDGLARGIAEGIVNYLSIAKRF